MKRVQLATATLMFGLGSAQVSHPSVKDNAAQLLSQSMEFMDSYYDPEAGYLYALDGHSALRHDTRPSAWYSLGLLARNNGSDVDEAEKIITNIISGQFTVKEEYWYGDYQKFPEEPYPGSPDYPAEIYGTFDPNWRSFIGTTFVMAVEEYSHLMSKETTDLIVESLHVNTVGDQYRVGGFNGDNLYPAYSNPSIMRALVSGWTGRRINDANITSSGESQAGDIIELFNMHDTLSEFNSPTYTAVSLFGLTLWSKYLSDTDSVMGANAEHMIRETWNAVKQQWHPGMKNMAGPWDRGYGYDMNRYLALMSLWFWTLLGREQSSLLSHPEVMSHRGDFSFGPLIAVLAEYQASLLPEDTVDAISTFDQDRTFTAQTFYPPEDLETRNITTWLSTNLTIGAQSYKEAHLGGPSIDQNSFNPAVVQWKTGSKDEIGFMSLYPTEKALQATVSPGKLELTYPEGNKSSVFTLIIGTFLEVPTVSGLADVQGLNITVGGNINQTYDLSFGGHKGGAWGTLRDFEYWNFTFTMPGCSQGKPTLTLDLDVLY